MLTSRNIRVGGFADPAPGGLDHRIGHHLFPGMPGTHLARARPIVRDHGAETGVFYHETGFVRSHVEALTHMRRAGAPPRARTPADRPRSGARHP